MCGWVGNTDDVVVAVIIPIVTFVTCYAESFESLGGLQLPLPRVDGPRIRNNSSQASPGLTPTALAVVSPNSAKKNTSPRSRNKSSGMDHAGTPLRATTMSPGGNFFGPPFPGANGAKRRSSLSKPSVNGGGRGKGRGKRVGEMGYMGYSGVEDGFEGLDSPMSADGGDTHQQVNGLNGEGLEEVRVSVVCATACDVVIVRVCVCMYCVCLYVCIYVCTYVYACMPHILYVCMYVCMYYVMPTSFSFFLPSLMAGLMCSVIRQSR